MKAGWKVKGLYKADAQKVADEIGEKSFKPEDLVEYARNHKDSELHKCFEWNDSIAAEKYRVQQARGILLNLVFEECDDKLKSQRVYHLTSETKTYAPLTQILQKDDEYLKLLSRAKAELEMFKRKYHSLKELHPVFEAIELI